MNTVNFKPLSLKSIKILTGTLNSLYRSLFITYDHPIYPSIRTEQPKIEVGVSICI